MDADTILIHQVHPRSSRRISAIRLAGDVVMAVGSWRRRPAWIAAGGLIVAAGWSHGLVSTL